MGSRLQPSGRGLRKEQIAEECEKSLRRLGVETIDLYYAHFFDPVTPVGESLEAFGRLVRAGKVRWIGASNHPAWRLAEARAVSTTGGWPAYCCVQQRHTYLRPRIGSSFGVQVAADGDLTDFCRERGVTLLAYSPLLGGCYTRADRPVPKAYAGPDSDARLAVLLAVAVEKGATPNQVVLAWMLHSRPAVIPIFSASAPKQMAENLGALAVDLTEDDVRRLDSAGA